MELVRPPLPAPLDTSRLTLRCIAEADAAPLSALMEPAISRWLLSWPVPFTLAMAAERIGASRRAARAGAMLPFAMERRSDGALLGWLSLTRFDADDRRALLSYWIGTRHGDQGFMREALAVAVPAVFDLLGVDIVVAEAQPANASSRALLERCGFRLVGERRTFAPARNRAEASVAYELTRPGARADA